MKSAKKTGQKLLNLKPAVLKIHGHRLRGFIEKRHGSGIQTRDIARKTQTALHRIVTHFKKLDKLPERLRRKHRLFDKVRKTQKIFDRRQKALKKSPPRARVTYAREQLPKGRHWRGFD